MTELEDMISNLPALVLHHILFFIGIRVASQSSVLSKRWKYIWRSIPNLQFRCHKSSRVQKFMRFVDTTLELHDDSNIQRFSRYSDLHLNKSKIENWISILISHNVQELSLQLNQRDTVLIPPPLYACESLVGLTLVSRLKICFLKYISFPRLKNLTLLRVKFRDECRNEEFFSNFLVLEFLCMECCTWSGMKNFCISNPALKHLIIINIEDGFQKCALNIRAPRMVAKDYAMSSLPTLGRAHIDFFFEEYGALIDYGAVVRKFLQTTADAVHLTISDRTLQSGDVDDASDDRTEDNHYNDAAEGEDNNNNENDGWKFGTVDASCSFLHLKLVSFKKFTGDAMEMRWLKIILNNAALETVTISCEWISDMKSENLMQDISSFPRALASCVFKFSSGQS